MTVKSIKKEAKKAKKELNKNQIKAAKAKVAAKQLLPEVKKAKL